MTAQTVSNAVATREAGPVKLMWSKRQHLDMVLPASVNVEAFLGTAAGALYASDVPGKNLTLMKCAQTSPDSLIVALMECAALGHMPGTDEYYLTPRLDHGRPKVLGIEGYRGVIERMYRSGAVAKVVVREVCARDYFHYIEGEMDRPIHKMAENASRTGAGFFGANGGQDRGPMVGAYAYAQLTTGAFSRIILLTRDDVFAARDSGGYKPDDSYSPWNRLDGGKDHPEFTGRSMWWKTAAKRLEPWVPTSAEYRREQLRASAAAADLAGMRGSVPDLPAASGHDMPEEVHDAEIVHEQPDPMIPATPAGTAGSGTSTGSSTARRAGGRSRRTQQDPDAAQQIVMHFGRLGITDRDERLAWTGKLAGRDLDSTSDLDEDERAGILERLSKCRDIGALDALTRNGDAPGGDTNG